MSSLRTVLDMVVGVVIFVFGPQVEVVKMRSVGTGVVMRSAGVERQGGALAEVIVTSRSHSAELIRGPARDSFGLARKRGLGWTQRKVPH